MEIFVEVLGWLRIAVSPILASAIGAFLLVLSGNVAEAILLLLVGCIIGVLWATSVSLKQGTVNLLAVNNTFSAKNTFWYRLIPASDGGAMIEIFAWERPELLHLITTILAANGFSEMQNTAIDPDLPQRFVSEHGEIGLEQNGEQIVYLAFDQLQLAKNILKLFRETGRFRVH